MALADNDVSVQVHQLYQALHSDGEGYACAGAGDIW